MPQSTKSDLESGPSADSRVRDAGGYFYRGYFGTNSSPTSPSAPRRQTEPISAFMKPTAPETAHRVSLSPDDYPSLAAALAHTPQMQVFRRFRVAGMLDLLYKEELVAAVEERLVRLDLAERESEHERLATSGRPKMKSSAGSGTSPLRVSQKGVGELCRLARQVIINDDGSDSLSHPGPDSGAKDTVQKQDKNGNEESKRGVNGTPALEGEQSEESAAFRRLKVMQDLNIRYHNYYLALARYRYMESLETPSPDEIAELKEFFGTDRMTRSSAKVDGPQSAFQKVLRDRLADPDDLCKLMWPEAASEKTKKTEKAETETPTTPPPPIVVEGSESTSDFKPSRMLVLAVMGVTTLFFMAAMLLLFYMPSKEQRLGIVQGLLVVFTIAIGLVMCTMDERRMRVVFNVVVSTAAYVYLITWKIPAISPRGASTYPRLTFGSPFLYNSVVAVIVVFLGTDLASQSVRIDVGSGPPIPVVLVSPGATDGNVTAAPGVPIVSTGVGGAVTTIWPDPVTVFVPVTPSATTSTLNSTTTTAAVSSVTAAT